LQCGNPSVDFLIRFRFVCTEGSLRVESAGRGAQGGQLSLFSKNNGGLQAAVMVRSVGGAEQLTRRGSVDWM
jgi:hypothetical protein